MKFKLEVRLNITNELAATAEWRLAFWGYSFTTVFFPCCFWTRSPFFVFCLLCHPWEDSLQRSIIPDDSPSQNWQGAMLLRPWSLRPRLFKTFLDHYFPWFITFKTSLDSLPPLIMTSLLSLILSLRPLSVMSPVWNVPGCFLIFVRYVSWSQCPLITMSLWSSYLWFVWLFFLHIFLSII